MVYIILFAVVLFIVSFVVKLGRTIIVKNTKTNKKYIDFKLINLQLVISSMLWGIVGALAFFYCVTLIIPLFWTLITSVKDNLDYAFNSFGFPRFKMFGWAFENYPSVLKRFSFEESGKVYGLTQMLFNSFAYAVVSPLVSVFWTTLIAYVMARYRFPGNKFIYNFGILIMLIPIVGTTASTMIIKRQLGLYDNMYLQMIIPPATPFSGMNFLIFYGAMKAIPMTYSEAAFIDGASRYTVMFRVIIPMVIPTCATFYILGFIAAWNSYEDFLVWYPSTPNISYGMYRFQGSAQSGSGAATTPEIMAGFMMCMIPSSILYLSSQKLISSKFTVGGLKG